jgi:hypothetical protein
MYKSLIFLFALVFALPQLAKSDTVSRPNANNKMNISKKTLDEKENSFINRLLKGDFDNVSPEGGNEDIIKQIKMLSNLKDEGVLTEVEFNDKKKLLLDKIN